MQNFRLAVESAPNGMVMINGAGQIVLVNAQTEKLFGYSRDELMGQPVELLVPERFRQNHPAFRAEFFASPVVRTMGTGRDLFGRRKDGSEFPVEIGLNPIQTEGELFILSAIVDITERKRGEEKFRLAVESAPNGMVMINAAGQIVSANAQTEKLFGYSRDELMGQPVELLVPERFRQNHPAFRAEFFASPVVRTMGMGRDLYGRRKDGSEFPVEIGLNPIQTEGELFVLSAIVDITERKRAEAARREAEERLHAVVENMNEGVVISDLDGSILHWNRAAIDMHGFASTDELLRRLPEFARVFELATLEGRIVNLEEWPLSRLLRGERYRHYELRVRRLDTGV